MCFHLDICINHNVHPSNDFIKFMANTYFIKNKIFNVCTYIYIKSTSISNATPNGICSQTYLLGIMHQLMFTTIGVYI